MASKFKIMEPHDDSEYMYMMQAQAYNHAIGIANAEALAHYDSLRIDQLHQEIENLEAGMESVKRSIDYHQNIYDGLDAQRRQIQAMVEPTFKKVKIPVGYETYMSDSHDAITLLEKAIVDAYRKGGHYSAEEFVITMNPVTLSEIAQYLMKTSHDSVKLNVNSDSKIFYKGMRVLRSADVQPLEFIIR